MPRLLVEAALSELEGKKTGKLQAHFDGICAAGGRFLVSGMSAKARGLSETMLADKPAEFAMPDVLLTY